MVLDIGDNYIVVKRAATNHNVYCGFAIASNFRTISSTQGIFVGTPSPVLYRRGYDCQQRSTINKPLNFVMGIPDVKET